MGPELCGVFLEHVWSMSTLLSAELPPAPTEILSPCPDCAELQGEDTQGQSQQFCWLIVPPTSPRYEKGKWRGQFERTFPSPSWQCPGTCIIFDLNYPLREKPREWGFIVICVQSRGSEKSRIMCPSDIINITEIKLQEP